jgi:hypothetical protein
MLGRIRNSAPRGATTDLPSGRRTLHDHGVFVAAERHLQELILT